MEIQENAKRERLKVIITLVVFALIYASISLVNHYLFRTSAFDLGIKNHAIYNFAQFKAHETTFVQPPHNYFSNHFVIITALVAPLYYLFSSYTLLVVQIASILTGGLGVYQYFRTFYADKSFVPIMAMIHFLSLWGITSALAFDYHENVVGAVILPWFFYFFRKDRWLPACLVALLILFCKENLALWMTFIAIGMLFFNYQDPRKKWFCLGLGIFSLIYFIGVVKFAIPYLGDGREFKHFKYSTTLGSGFSEAFQTIFTQPFTIIKYLFVNHLDEARFNGVKGELHLMVLVSGGFAFFFRPQWLVMLIPIYAQKLLHDDPQKWGINLQYSIEFVPILTFALFELIVKLTKHQIKKIVIFSSVILAMVFHAIKLEDRRSVWYSGARSQFYSSDFYKRSFNVSQVHKTLDKKIPPQEPVSTHTQLGSHLAFRDTIYMFPTIKNAKYIALLDIGNTFPVKKDAYQEKIEELKSAQEWELIHDENKLIILRRKE